MKASTSYQLNNNGIELLESAIKRKFPIESEEYKKIYKGQGNARYNYFSLKNALGEINFKVSDETLKQIIERKKGSKKTTIQSIFKALGDSFDDELISVYDPSKKENYTSKKENIRREITYKKFIGREKELEQILEFVNLKNTRPYIMSIYGTSGIGKTSLAVEVSCKCLDSGENKNLEYDAIVFVDINESDTESNELDDIDGKELDKNSYPAASINKIFSKFAQVMEEPSITSSKHEKQKEKVLKILEKYRTLIVIDNFHNINNSEINEISDFLTRVPIPTKIILTTQKSLQICASIQLQGMYNYEEELYKQYGGHKRLKDINANLKTGGNPQVIRHIVNLKNNELIEKIAQDCSLKKENQILGCVIDKELAVIKNTEAHKILIAASMFHDSATYEALIETSGLGDSSYSQLAIEELKDLNLIELVSNKNEKDDVERFFLHSSTYKLILESRAEQPPEMRERWIAFYKKLTNTYGGTDWGNWINKYTKIKFEWSNITSVLEYCAINNRYEDVKEIWDNISHFADLQGFLGDRLSWLNWLQVKSEKEDLKTYSECLSRKAWTLFIMGGQDNWDEALSCLNKSEECLDKCFDNRKTYEYYRIKISIIHHFAKAYIALNQYDLAKTRLFQLEKILNNLNVNLSKKLSPEEQKFIERQYVNLNRDFGELYFNLREYSTARDYYIKALEISQKIEWLRGNCIAFSSLAEIMIEENDDVFKDNYLNSIEKYLRQAQGIAKLNQHLRRLARIELIYAKLEKKRNNKERSYDFALSALDKFTKLEMQDKIEESNEFIKELKFTN